MLDDLTADQVTEWAAYNELEPVGEYHRDYMHGQLMALIHNLAQSIYGKKGKRKTVRPEDFLPWMDRAAEHSPQSKSKVQQSPDDIKSLFMDLKKTMPQKRGKKEKLHQKTGQTMKRHKQKGDSDG